MGFSTALGYCTVACKSVVKCGLRTQEKKIRTNNWRSIFPECFHELLRQTTNKYQIQTNKCYNFFVLLANANCLLPRINIRW